MPILCHTDSAHGAAVRNTLLCEGCYRAALAKLRNEFLPRKARVSEPIRGTGKAQAEVNTEADRKLAQVIAHSVVAAGGPVSRLDKRLDMERDSRLTRAIAIARQEQWIELVNGKGFVPGPRALAPRCSARSVALDVWALDRPLAIAEIEARYRLARRSASRYVSQARDAGWIVNVHGQGYARGAKKPPENSDAR